MGAGEAVGVGGHENVVSVGEDAVECIRGGVVENGGSIASSVVAAEVVTFVEDHAFQGTVETGFA